MKGLGLVAELNPERRKLALLLMEEQQVWRNYLFFHAVHLTRCFYPSPPVPLLNSGVSKAALVFVICVCITACSIETAEKNRSATWVEDTMNSLTLEEKVSQMIVAGMDESGGLRVGALGQITFAPRPSNLGGVLLSGDEPYQLAAASISAKESPDIPLLVAKDLFSASGPQVSVMNDQISPMALAATRNPALIRRIGEIVGQQARAIGVDVLLARAQLGDHPGETATPAKNSKPGLESFVRDDYRDAFMSGLGESRVFLAEAPGDGLPAVRVDSISGTGFADGFPGIDPSSSDLPSLKYFDVTAAKLSNPDSLRREILKGLQAGSDIFLSSPNVGPVRASLMRLFNDRMVSLQRIDQSVRNILAAKAALRAISQRKPKLEGIHNLLMNREHAAISASAARASIVAARLGNFTMDTRFDDSVLIVVLVEEAFKTPVTFASRVDMFYEPNAITRYVPYGKARDIFTSLSADVAASKRIILADLTRPGNQNMGTAPDGADQTRAQFVGEMTSLLTASGKPLLFAGLSSAGHIRFIPDDADTILLSFGDSEPAQLAMAQAILGRAEICGKLPVDILPDYHAGTGQCQPQFFPRIGFPGEVGLDDELLEGLGHLLSDAIADSAFPGASVGVGRKNVIATIGGIGGFTYQGAKEITSQSIYDLASLTKVIATTTAVMLLYEDQLLALDDPVSQYLPEFAENDKAGITIRDLLTHMGGLIPFRPFYQTGLASRSSILTEIMADSLVYEPGAQSVYSDFGPIMLAEIVKTITGVPFDEYTRNAIFRPLGMKNTGFRPASSVPDENIVPTENDDYFRNTLVQGSVHDENAFILGGTAGHAGLFSTVEDLARFATMYLNEGRIGTTRFLQPETIRLFTTRVSSDYTHTRALGWDTKSQAGYSSAGRHFGMRAFGHTGFTGTSIWFDPDQSLYVILLTNRVYPTRDNSKHRRIRPEVADRVFEAIRKNPDVYYFKASEE